MWETPQNKHIGGGCRKPKLLSVCKPFSRCFNYCRSPGEQLVQQHCNPSGLIYQWVGYILTLCLFHPACMAPKYFFPEGLTLSGQSCIQPRISLKSLMDLELLRFYISDRVTESSCTPGYSHNFSVPRFILYWSNSVV